MRILLIWPPELRRQASTFRHFCQLGSVAGYLRRKHPDAEMMVRDGLIENTAITTMTREFLSGYNVVAVQIEPYTVESAQCMIRLLREVSSSRVIAFGSMCCLNPAFIMSQLDLDAICFNENWEYAVSRFVSFSAGNLPAESLFDIQVRDDTGQIRKNSPGPPVDPEDWCLPPFDLMDIRRYDAVTSLSHHRELRVCVSRACPFHCPFCRNTYMGLASVVHRSPDAVARVLAEAHARYPDMFDKYSLASANFTLDESWATAVCEKIQALNLPIRWSTMTRVSLLQEKVVRRMARAGCYKIGLGIETLGATQSATGKVIDEKLVEYVVRMLRRHGIQPRACIMLGIPGQTKEEVLYTFMRLHEWGASIRPKEYYPFQELTVPGLTMDTVRRFDRSEYCVASVKGMSRSLMVRLLLNGQVPDEAMREVLSAGTVTFCILGGQPHVLLLQARNGRWCLPRGKPHSHESLADTAQRETFEECGLTVRIGEEVGVTVDHYWSPSGKSPTRKTTKYFLAFLGVDEETRVDTTDWLRALWVPWQESEALLADDAFCIVRKGFERFAGGVDCHSLLQYKTFADQASSTESDVCVSNPDGTRGVAAFYPSTRGNVERYVHVSPRRILHDGVSPTEALSSYEIRPLGFGLKAVRAMIERTLTKKLGIVPVWDTDFWRKVSVLKLECAIAATIAGGQTPGLQSACLVDIGPAFSAAERIDRLEKMQIFSGLLMKGCEMAPPLYISGRAANLLGATAPTEIIFMLDGACRLTAHALARKQCMSVLLIDRCSSLFPLPEKSKPLSEDG